MKKHYLFLSGIILITSIGFSQSLMQNSIQIDRGEGKLREAEVVPPAKILNQNKVPGTILFSEDFGSGTPTSLPLGWSVGNPNANGFEWIWSNTAPGGQYSTNMTALNSPTANNGYMSLPCDFYNTPFPGGTAVDMDTWFTSPRINISPAVGALTVEYVHAMRYCCRLADELVLEVSTDSLNWSTPYDAIGGRGFNTATPNGEVLQINVSPDLAYSTTAYLRFRSTGNSHYYWMIDDVKLIEGNGNNMQLTDFSLKFHSQYGITPIYTYLPIINSPAVTYTGISYNAGANTQTNVDLNLSVIMDSTIGGGPGTGVVHTASTLIGASIPSLQSDTAEIVSPFFSFNTGWYRNNVFITSDSVNQDPQSAIGNYSFALTADTTLALDRGELFFQGSEGPGGFASGGQDNDAVAALMIIDSSILQAQPTVLAQSISVFIANRTETDGVSIAPRIWSFDETRSTLDSAVVRPAIGGSPFATTITPAQQGTWVSLPIFPPRLLAPGAYVFGVEQTGGGFNGKEIWLGRDLGQEEIAADFSNLFFLNDPVNPRWIVPNRIIGIRFNGGFTTGIKDQSSNSNVSFGIFPNPSNGEFLLRSSSTSDDVYVMNVRSTSGQVVLSETLRLNALNGRSLDLSSYEKGIYILSLQNGNESIVKKLIVQ